MDKVFAALPADGQYSSGFAMAEMENGYAILVKATVDKAGTEDKPDPVTLKSIAAAVDPTKTYYTDGKFSKSDLTVTASYSNGTTKTLKEDEYKLTIGGAEVTTSYTFNSVGNQTFTIEYGGETTTVTVNVVQSEVASIEVTKKPSKTTYTAGDTFSPAGMEVTVTYNSGKTETIENITTNGEKGVSWEPADGLAAGTNSVTIIYTDDKGQTISTKVPVTVDNVVEGTGYKFNKTANKATITGETGLVELFDEHKTDAASATIILEKDQTLTGTAPLTDTFTGTLNGNGKTITLTENRTQGLFNEIGTGGTVQNVDIEVSGPISGNGNIGAVAGENNGTIQNCHVTGTGASMIKGSGRGGRAGGVVGFNDTGGTVIACTSSGSVSGSTYVGGVVGDNYGTVTACTASGSVKGSSNVGGVVGYNSSGSVTACTSSGSVEGSGDVGGVVGDNYGTVTACYWSDYAGKGIGNGNDGETTRVDGTTVTWQTAVDAMNTALQNAGSEWRYELTGELPTLKKQ